MNHPDLNTSVPDWLIDFPELLPLFEALKVDYCCGGKSLEFACREQGLNPQDILAQLRAYLGTIE